MFIFLLFATSMVACKSSLEEDLSSTEAIPSTEEMATTASAGTLKRSSPFKLGAAVKMYLLKEKHYSDLLKSEFASITPESEMKWNTVRPSEKQFVFDKGDRIVNFAQQNGMRVHGTTLIWAKDSVYPKWLREYQGDRKAWDRLLKTHIQTVVKHYKGKVASWDVVNEAITPEGDYKDCIWLRKLGKDYIAKAYTYAHQADPKALLFYNDYSQEFGGRKMAFILSLVAQAKKNNVPLHGLGFQLHTNTYNGNAELIENINAAAATGLLLHLSEVEVQVRRDMPATFKLSSALAKTQADKYKAITKAYLAIPKKQQFGITTWGVGDYDSFRNTKVKDSDHPLLFDEDYKAKPAYYAMLDAIRGK
jgi:endo-1,4-beta-xylanase